MITSVTLIVAGLYLILLSFMMDTENFRSTFFFKFVPFILGSALLVLAAESSGFIRIGS